MPAPFEKFLQIANFFYTSIGIIPYHDLKQPKSKQNTLILNFVFYFSVINLNVIGLGEIIFIVMAFSTGTNFIEAIVTAAYVGFVAVADCKMISVWYTKAELTDLIGELRIMYPTTANKQEAYRLNTYLQHVTTVMVLFASLYMVLIWTFNLFDILQYIIYTSIGMGIEKDLPYNIYLPFDWHNSVWYFVLYLIEVLAGYTSAAGIISSDLLLCSVVTQVCMHYDYITRKIEDYVPRGEKDNREFISEMVLYHQKILRLSDRINSSFGVPLLFNFSASTFIICFVGFQITTGVTNEELFKFMLFLVSSLTQVYLICYYGQRIATASENIASALYHQIWYEHASSSYKKTLIIMMQRAQKPTHLKATIFLPITMNTFTEVGQLSYKFFALLRTMYSK